MNQIVNSKVNSSWSRHLYQSSQLQGILWYTKICCWQTSYFTPAYIPSGLAWFIFHRDNAACCMVRPHCISVTAVLGRLSGLAPHHPLPSLLAASLFPGAGNFSCHRPSQAGLGRPDLAPAHFPPSPASEGRVRVRPAGRRQRRQHRVLDNKDCGSRSGWRVFQWHY